MEWRQYSFGASLGIQSTSEGAGWSRAYMHPPHACTHYCVIQSEATLTWRVRHVSVRRCVNAENGRLRKTLVTELAILATLKRTPGGAR